MLLAYVAERIGLYESNVLSTVLLSTIIFGMAGRQALGAPDLLILEA